MQDYKDHMNITLSGKTHSAIISFLKKHNADTHDISRFIEDAATWRMLDREMAFKNARAGEVVELYAHPSYQGKSEY